MGGVGLARSAMARSETDSKHSGVPAVASFEPHPRQAKESIMNTPSAARPRSLGRLLASLLLASTALAGTALVVAAAPMSVQLGTRTSATLGTYLTGPNGHALSPLSSEPKHGVVCIGGCLGLWPPLLVSAGGTVHGPSGVAGTFGTFVRSDTHSIQAALNGHALYSYAGDGSATDTNG